MEGGGQSIVREYQHGGGGQSTGREYQQGVYIGRSTDRVYHQG
jgi:hypothetical protein